MQPSKLDVLIDGLSAASNDNDVADAVPLPAPGPAITRPGDLWRIGNHRLICADATKAESYQALLGDDLAQMVFADPPYNVPIAGHVGGLGEIQHREFAMASGEMSASEFTDFALATPYRAYRRSCRHRRAIREDSAMSPDNPDDPKIGYFNLPRVFRRGVWTPIGAGVTVTTSIKSRL